MRTVYFHEDDYCQCEVLPLAAKEYCLREMGDIDAFAEEHKEGQFYTDIYMREDSPHTLRELALRSRQFAAALDFLPAFDRVETGYSSYREECKATCARGFSNELVVFWETDEEGFVTALWLAVLAKVENADTVRRIYTALGRLAPLLLADWNLSACVDLTDSAAIEKYLQSQLHTENDNMNREEMLKQINEWHKVGENQKIIDAIEALPREEWGYELTCLLARAYNNMKGAPQLEKAVSLFESVREEGQDDPLWHYRLGYALYYLHRAEEALTCFRRALELDPDDSDTLQFIGWCEADQKTKVVVTERVGESDRSDFKEINMDTDAVKQELKDLCRNAIHLNIGGKGASVVGGTRFGGVPDVPADFVWPTYEGTSYNDDEIKSRPLSFLAQFNCAEFAPLDTEGLLPTTGVLSFFYEMESMRWGFDPKDAGCGRVFWFEDTSALAPAQVPEDLVSDLCFPMLKIAMESGTSYIDGQDFRILHEGEIDWEAMGDILNELAIEDPENCSKLLGWPNLIQDSIMLECEFASRGYYLGNPEGWAKVPQNEREEKMQTSLEDWRLLFQLDTVESKEDGFELMFGDCGRLYFCIRKEDLRARRFDRIWLISQCY